MSAAPRILSRWSIVLQDVHYGLRSLGRHPGYTAGIVLALALGIGVNTAVFVWLDTFLLGKLPVPQPSALVQIAEVEGGHTWLSLARSTFEDLRELNQVFSGIAGSSMVFASVEGDNEPSTLEMVSGSYFPMLGLKSAAGRLLTPADDTASGQNAVAVVSHRYWKTRFGGDAAAIGSSLRINGTRVVVIGVTPAAFRGVSLDKPSDIFVPLSIAPLMMRTATEHVEVLGRLRPGVTQEQAAVNLQSIHRGMAPRLESRVVLLPAGAGVFSRLREKMASPLWLVSAAALLLLLTTCSNVAGMMLIRAIDRRREMAVRRALGASRARLVRLSLIESLVLSTAGAASGLVALAWSESLLRMLIPGDGTAFEVNGRVALFVAILSLVTGVVCGLPAGLRAAQERRTERLNDGSERVTRGSRAGDCLIAVQVALSLTLLFPAILCFRSLGNLERVNVGFEKDRVLLAHINPAAAGYEGGRIAALYEELLRRLQDAPGISSASFSSLVVYQQGFPAKVAVSEDTGSAPHGGRMYWDAVSSGYFGTVGIPILSGRDFAAQSRERGRVTIINRSMSEFLFRDRNPLGRRIRMLLGKEAEEFEVIGVAGDARYGSLRRETDRMAYIPYTQAPSWVRPAFTIELRVAGAQGDAVRSLRDCVRALDPTMPVTSVRTLSAVIDDSTLQERLVTRVVAGSSVIALLVTCVGIYGAMSYLVRRRTREIAVRIAVGARRSNVMWLVGRKALLLVSLGMIVAVPSGLAFSRFLKHLLFGVSESDPLWMLLSCAAIAFVGSAAAYWPARAASEVDPIRALGE